MANKNEIKTGFNGTQYFYENDKLVKEILPNGDTYQYFYENGKLSKEIRPNGNIYQYFYKDDKLVKEICPNGDIYQYFYENGLLVIDLLFSQYSVYPLKWIIAGDPIRFISPFKKYGLEKEQDKSK